MWLSTWIHNGAPKYAEHPSETAAAAHAERLIRSGDTKQATYFEIEGISE